MKSRVIACVLACLLCQFLFSNPKNEVLFRDSGNYIEVYGDSTFSVSGSTIQNQTLLDTLLFYNASSIEKVFPSFTSEDTSGTDCFGRGILLNDLSNIYKVTVNDSIDAENLIQLLCDDTTFFYIDYAEFNYNPITEEENSNTRVDPEDIDDELFSQQWYLYNNGNPGDINILDAWDITMGDENIKVGIIEPRTSYNHEDLNGCLEYSGGSSENNHATSTTGEIVANHNSSFIAGVTAFCKVRSYGILAQESEFVDKICDAYNNAFSNNCRVLNNSWSWDNEEVPDIPYTSSLNMENLIRQGAIFVCSSGNDGNAVRTYPSAYALPGILAIGASTKNYHVAGYST